MDNHQLRVYNSSEELSKEQQLAFKFAKLANDYVEPSDDVVDMVINRIIDNAAVAVASLNRAPIKTARAQATANTTKHGASLFGMVGCNIQPNWAAWHNGVAVRELDYHDTFLAADYSHPGDNIPPILAVAQSLDCNGKNLIAGILTAYEIQINLVKSICLHEHKIDHIAHIGSACAAGIGSLLNLDTDIIFQAINASLHCTITTRQSRKGAISSWKAFAPAYAGKTAIEMVDRAMRGEGAPSPIYEGEDSLLAWILNGRTLREQNKDPREACYYIAIPKKGEEKRAILESYTKEHSAEYQSQALIDLAFELHKKITNKSEIKSIMIHTSHHTHFVIGTGAGDPQKMDPNATRETLDHSIMYIFAVSLEDGFWHHEKSYTKERANRLETISLWHKIATCEDAVWTKKYHSSDPQEKAFGARVVVTMNNGEVIECEKTLANAHPYGARPFTRKEYKQKFMTLTCEILSPQECQRFFALVEDLPNLPAEQIKLLNPVLDINLLESNSLQGIFRQ